MPSTMPSSDIQRGTPLVQCARLYKSYGNGREIFRDVNFEIDKGDFVFLMGPGGAGKSTMLRLLLGLDLPNRGHILFAGRSLQRMSAKEIPYFRRRTGAVFQDPKLIMDRTVFANVALPLHIRGNSSEFIRSKVDQVLGMLNLDHKVEARCSHLSTGEQQLVAVARAVIHDPILLVLDEPSGRLDDETLCLMMGVLRTIHVRGTTILLASHVPALIEAAPRGRVLAIHDGTVLERVVVSGTTVWK